MRPFFAPTQPDKSVPDRLRGLFPVVGVAAFLALIAWNWPLALALTLGAIVTVVLYRIQSSPWQTWVQRFYTHWESFWQTPHRILILSLLGGGVTAGGCLLTTTVWQDLGSIWAASGFALEGVGLLALGMTFLLQNHYQQQLQYDELVDEILRSYRHPDALQRLQGVYRTERLCHKTSLHPDQFQIVLNGLAILAQQEAIAEVRNTALDTLDRLSSVREP